MYSNIYLKILLLLLHLFYILYAISISIPNQIQMLGYDISWAGFNIIEVMSSSRFTCKRIGYLAASQCFHPDSEVSPFQSTRATVKIDSLSFSSY